MKKITFYGANWCGYCVQLQAAMDKEKIPYEYVNVDEGDGEEQMLQASGGRYLIPTLTIGDETVQNPPIATVRHMAAT